MTFIQGLVLCFIMVCIAIGIFIFVLDKLSQPKDSNTFSTRFLQSRQDGLVPTRRFGRRPCRPCRPCFRPETTALYPKSIPTNQEGLGHKQGRRRRTKALKIQDDEDIDGALV